MFVMFTNNFRYITGYKPNGKPIYSKGFHSVKELYKHRAKEEGKKLSDFKFHNCIIVSTLNNEEDEARPLTAKRPYKKRVQYNKTNPYIPPIEQ